MANDTDLREDVAAAKKKMRVKVGAGREIKRLTRHLWEGETVEQMTTGMYGKGSGLVVVTDRRLLFVHEGMMSQTSEDFPMDKVSSVQWQAGMMTGGIVIFASGNKSEIKMINKDDGKEIVDRIRHRISAPSHAASSDAAPAAASNPPPADPMEQIKKLGELRDAGLLTQEEFDSKKADLLNRM